MFFKLSSIRLHPVTGELDGYYRLVESYRTADGKVRHRILLEVGFMDGVTPEDMNRIQKLLTHKCQCSDKELFTRAYEREPEHIQRWFRVLYDRFVKEKKIDVPQPPSTRKNSSSVGDWHTIDLNSLRHRDIREIGSENLCYQAIRQLGLDNFLASQVNWSDDDVRLALTHIISRAVYPASELKWFDKAHQPTSRWICENSAVCELTEFPIEKINKDRLYDISNRLYAMKDSLERWLSHRTNELFDIEDKIIIYDLTNTYFEGTKRSSQLARFGRSKEKRSDAKLAVIEPVEILFWD
jgi:hypothetical protein